MQLSLSVHRQIMSAADGEEALTAVDGDTWPDFVFLDYQMNVGDSGDEVVL